MNSRLCCQINYQRNPGGGEVYTRTVSRALRELGWQQLLFVHREARFWDGFDLGDVERVRISRIAEIDARLPRAGALLLTHNIVDAPTARRWAATNPLAGFLHMPLWERNPAGAAEYHLLLPVSEHVRASAWARGLANVHSEPLLAAADLDPRGTQSSGIRRGSLYDQDSRKLRDRVFAWAGDRLGPRRAAASFARRSGLTLGIVSRITPIKQFPLLFSILAPILAAQSSVYLEVFGSGEWGSVREMRRALAPLGDRVRYWGRQEDIAAVYPLLDYVLSGLPEKEALGLNLIEAQFAGAPVIAVRSPPFTETVLDGETGFLYRDPREDRGEEFAVLLERLARGAPRPDPRKARGHLLRFSPAAFSGRLSRALDALDR